MNKPLSYADLYSLCEELSQLRGSPLQNVVSESQDRYYMQFYFQGRLCNVALDLSAGRPFILSIKSPLPKKQSKPTPTLNFLKAHFKGLIFKEILMAQKPNRTIKILFSNDEKDSVLEFLCFPHGQCLKLTSDGKTVIYPKQIRREEGEVSFVELDPPAGGLSWKVNEDFEELWGLKKSKGPVVKGPTFAEKQISKIQKSIDKIEGNREKFLKTTEEKIQKLKSKALDLQKQIAQGDGSQGVALNKIYAEIKKLRRGILEFSQRKNLLQSQIKGFQENPQTLPVKPQERVPEVTGFSGTRVYINESWELWVGRNAAQNDELVRLGSPHDLWFHLRDYPGAHGLLRGPKNSEPSEAHILFACQVVGQLSKSKKKPFAEGEYLDFTMTQRKFVKKKKGMAAGAVIVEREKVRRIAYREVRFTVRGRLD